MIDSWVILDGQCIPENKAAISVTDRGFLFGDGAFTTIKVQNGIPEFYEEHAQQLRQHCLNLFIKAPDISYHCIQELITKNKAETGSWRLKIIVTGGSIRLLNISEREYGHVIMMLHPYVAEAVAPHTLATFPIQTSGLLAKVKSLAYLERLWIKQLALQEGYVDAVVTTQEGYLLETAFANIFWISDNTFYFPDPSLPYLVGVTLLICQKKAKSLGMTLKPIMITLEELPIDANVYICNSMLGVMPVSRIGIRSFNLKTAIWPS